MSLGRDLSSSPSRPGVGDGHPPRRVRHLVLTGGPQGGKTTGVRVLAEALGAEGHRVLMAPELATRLFTHGVRPGDYAGERNRGLRRLMLQMRRDEENGLRELALLGEASGGRGEGPGAAPPGAPTVVLYDRGLVDEAVYTDSWTQYQDLLGELGLAWEAVLARYDGVLHLRTCAVVPGRYVRAQNPARVEGGDTEAIEADAATLAAWSHHPRLRVIENPGPATLDPARSWAMKAQALVSAARELLHEAPPAEAAGGRDPTGGG